MFHEQLISKGQIWLSSNWSCVRSFFSLYLQYVLLQLGKVKPYVSMLFLAGGWITTHLKNMRSRQIGTIPPGSG